MSKKKFLTVMAVFDAETQRKLYDIQKYLIDNISQGTQTMGIPFHISLGSYPTDELTNVISEIEMVSKSVSCFDIKLMSYGNFAKKVFFLKPEIPEELLILRKRFESDYANGYEWEPHATLFCGNEDDVTKAMSIAPELDFPILAKIVGIELGEFFPPNKKFSTDFKK